MSSVRKTKLLQRPHPDPVKAAAGKTKHDYFIIPQLAEAKILWTRKLIEFHKNIQRPVSPENVRWDPVITDFKL